MRSLEDTSSKLLLGDTNSRVGIEVSRRIDAYNAEDENEAGGFIEWLCRNMLYLPATFEDIQEWQRHHLQTSRDSEREQT